MKEKDLKFKVVDVLLIAFMILPIVCGILLKVLLIPAPNGIEITGAHIFFTIPLPFGGLPITESQVNSWLVMISILGLCLYLTHGIKTNTKTRRQHIAELIVEKTDSLVNDNMGEFFKEFSPFIASILCLSAFSSLLTLFGLYPPTSDINIVGGWAILVSLLITYYKMKLGPKNYSLSFFKPVALLFPLNVINEFATPVSMAFRHYGNVLSGSIISLLVATGLQGLSSMLFAWLPGKLAEIPFLQIGLPAIMSVYFDVFSGCLQAFIFAMLTMLYVAGAFSVDDYIEYKNKKKKTVKQN